MQVVLKTIPAALILVSIASYAAAAERTTGDGKTATTDTATGGAERTTDRGSNATAILTAESTVTCDDGRQGQMLTNATIIARENVVQASGKPVANRLLEVNINSFDTCDSSFVSAFGSLQNPQRSEE